VSVCNTVLIVATMASTLCADRGGNGVNTAGQAMKLFSLENSLSSRATAVFSSLHLSAQT